MIKQAREAARRVPVQKSVFQIEKGNKLVTKFREEWRREEGKNWRDTFKKVRDEGRKAEHERMWREKSREFGLISNQPLATARAIDSFRSRLIRRRITLWVLRRHIGKPLTCRNCLEARGTYEHVQECIGARIDQSISTGQWIVATQQIADVEERCLGRRIGRLRTELEEETEEEEKKKEALEQERTTFKYRGGQWAYWRYHAQ